MKKIITLRNERRPLNEHYVSFLKSVDSTLRTFPDYIGVAPFGSQFKGCATEESDYDVVLILRNSAAESSLRAFSYIRKIAAWYGKIGEIYTTFSTGYFVDNFRVPSRYSESQYYHSLSPLAYDWLGDMDEIRRFKQMAVERHQEAMRFNKNFAQNMIDEAVKFLIFHELGILIDNQERDPRNNYCAYKIMNRGYSLEELRMIAKRRSEMWRKRILGFLKTK